jgi:hypothetical protein
MALINPITAGQGLDPGGIPSTARDSGIERGLAQLAESIGHAGAVAGEHELRLLKQKKQARDFSFEQQFLRGKQAREAAYAEMQANMDPTGLGFTELVQSTFNDQFDEFFGTVPPDLQPQFAELLQTEKEGWLHRAAADEVAQRRGWYTTSINEGIDTAQTAVSLNPGAFDDRLSDVHRLVDASDLTATQKVELKKQASEMLGLAWFDRQMRDNPGQAKGLLGVGGDSLEQYFAAIRQAESGGNDQAANPNSSARGRYQFIQSTWDELRKRHPGAGLTADGRNDPAQQEIAIRLFTAENAEKLAVAGIPATNGNLYSAHFLGAAGAINVLKAPDGAALAGVLPPEVIKANPFLRGMTVGDFRKWAASKGAGSGSGKVAPQLADVSFEKRVQLYEGAVRREHEQATSAAAADRSARDARNDQLSLAIETGSTTRQEILDDPILDDGQKAVLLNKQSAQDGKDAVARDLIAAWQAGSALPANPFDRGHVTAVNDAFDYLTRTNPEAVASDTLGFIRDFGVVPDKVIAAMRRGLGGDVSAVTTALQQAATIEQLVPNALGAATNGDELAKAAAKYRYLTEGLGLTGDAVGQRYIDMNDPEKRKQREALLETKAVKDQLKRIDGGFVAQAFATPGLIPFTTSAPKLGETPFAEAAMTAEYKALYEESLVDTAGDMDGARRLADERIRLRYGASPLTLAGEGVVSFLPPEKTYPLGVDGTHGYIIGQAKAALSAEGVETSEVWLQSYPETEKAWRAGQQALYQLHYRDADGLVQMFNLPFYADPAHTDEFAFDDARSRRDQNIETGRTVDDVYRRMATEGMFPEPGVQ